VWLGGRKLYHPLEERQYFVVLGGEKTWGGDVVWGEDVRNSREEKEECFTAWRRRKKDGKAERFYAVLQFG